MKASNPNPQTPGKLQIPIFHFAVCALVLGDCDFVGAWDLEVGVSEWFAA
jgi:hypothetical protein